VDEKKLAMTMDEVATELQISRPTAYDLARSEGFPALKVGRRVIVPRIEFERWLSESAINRLEFETRK